MHNRAGYPISIYDNDSTGSMYFLGGTQVTDPGPFLAGVPQSQVGEGYPLTGLRFLLGVPQYQAGEVGYCTPVPGGGTPV